MVYLETVFMERFFTRLDVTGIHILLIAFVTGKWVYMPMVTSDVTDMWVYMPMVT